MLRFLSIIILLLVLWGCAPSPPPEATRLAPARYALARAYALGAPDLAPEEYRRAKAKLEKGALLSRRGDSEKADLALKQAIFFALRASETSRESWEADVAPQERQRLTDPESGAANAYNEVRLLEPERVGARERRAEQPVTELEPPELQEPPRQNEPAAEPDPEPVLPKAYVVRDGETLWTIAARRSIYRDALLWPLIYRANRDQIKDPRQIFPQQVLTIPRDVTEGDMDEAREKARRSEVFPVEVLMRRAEK